MSEGFPIPKMHSLETGEEILLTPEQSESLRNQIEESMAVPAEPLAQE